MGHGKEKMAESERKEPVKMWPLNRWKSGSMHLMCSVPLSPFTQNLNSKCAKFKLYT